MSVLIPWDHVKAILSTHGDTLQVICLALPCQPRQVYTSKLLKSIFPNQGFKETINGFIALRMYMVCWQYFRQTLEEAGSPYWERVDARLKQDQQELLDGENEDDETFLLSYLHAYEVTITKCMHLKRLLQASFADDPTTKDLTEPLLNMDSHIIESLGIRDYLTPISLPDPTESDNDTIQQMIKQQSDLQSEMDTVAAKEAAKTDVSAVPPVGTVEPSVPVVEEATDPPVSGASAQPPTPPSKAKVSEIEEGVSDLKL